MEFREQLAIYAERTEAELNRLLPLISCPQQEVVEAMRYSLLGGGKRLRAALLLAFTKLAAEQGKRRCLLPVRWR